MPTPPPNPLLQILNGSPISTGTIERLRQGALAIYLSNLLILQIVSIVICIGFIIGVILIAINTGWYASRVDRVRDVILKVNTPKKQAKDSWKKVQSHFFAGDDNDLKIAIMEADQLLENALRQAGVRGANLGDRLKNLKREQVPNLDEIWQAHKLRNQIAHEAGFKLKRDLAERALGIYEKALQNLGALEAE